MRVAARRRVGQSTVWLRLVCDDDLPEVEPGNFLQLRYPTPGVLLNRPYSILNAESHSVELLIRDAGKQSHHLFEAPIGAEITVILPLGNGFSLKGKRPLLVGGGVGLAPLVQLAAAYKAIGIEARLVYGERSTPDSFMLELASRYASSAICTDDGSMGLKGFVTSHPWLNDECDADIFHVCGPTPMMRGVSAIAAAKNIPCEVSLENRMACGLGACLCCVQDTKSAGHVCVCTYGPVFNAEELKW